MFAGISPKKIPNLVSCSVDRLPCIMTQSSVLASYRIPAGRYASKSLVPILFDRLHYLGYKAPPSKGAVIIREANIRRAARYQKASACKHLAGSGNRSYTRDRSMPSLPKARDGLAQTNGSNDVSYAALRSKAQRSHGGKRFHMAQDSPTRRGARDTRRHEGSASGMES